MPAGFDPSVLSEIGGYGPNPVKAQSDAYTLAGQQQNVQMGGIELQEAKQKQSDEAKVRELLKGAKLDTFEDQTRVAQAITKINPKMGMDFMARVQQNRSEQQKYTLDQLEEAAKTADQLGGALSNVAQQLDAEARKPGANPAMLDAKTKQLVIPAALQLRQTNPALAPHIDKALQDPQTLTYQGFTNLVGQSKQHREQLQQLIQRRREEEQERHNREMERLAVTKETHKESEGGTPLSEGAQKLKDELAARDKSFMSRMGGKSIAEQNRIIEDWYRSGKKAEDIIGARQETAGTAAEVQSLYKQKAGLARTEKSIVSPGGFLEQAEKAVQEVDPNAVKSLGKLNQWRLDQITDPALQNYHTRITELRAEYAIVLSKGGQVTDAARTEAERVVPDYMTPASFARVKEAIQQGIAASAKGVDESIQEATKQRSGVAPFSDPEKERRYQEWKRTHG